MTVKADVPVGMREQIDAYASKLSAMRKGPVTRAQAIRELLDLALRQPEQP